ncbi:tRNA1(Val) (adenine(37)-N6)-methyltransferase [Ferruginibacter sp. HRS2-29]|uniref:tRNA1(Val) (adenine(37)-N6)-methyltransferase n=1 Tax=Ferruginibacter sp. HRS2-29 TaxID=2487334 RepID=UPI0020CD413F|nr:methyltransferase [Ferruginibacter sp. HRS2-29]MCP9751920.1 methyltransferase domain-containing protein [Ferruginibacter sp. HRS2-29]
MFSFKKFTIHQDKCAMKVCTDACLFGAWVAEKMKGENETEFNVLDIGTGTGLLSLMLAQQLKGKIESIELDAPAATQAAENFAASPWKERLKVHTGKIQGFVSGEKYGLIISNPPFFEADLRSPDASRNAAMHDTTLTLEELMKQFSLHIAVEGSGAVLIPFHRTEYLESLLDRHGFFTFSKAVVKQTTTHACFRTMLLFSKKEREKKEEEIIIHDGERVYTERFAELLRPYYLKL